MPAPVTESTGLVTIQANSSVVYGIGTAFMTAAVLGGTIHIAGQSAVITQVVNEQQVQVAPAFGESFEGYPYIIDLSRGEQATTAAANQKLNEIIERLNLASFFQFDDSGTAADRTTNNLQRKGFVFLQTDVNPPMFYIKLTDTSGDWSAGTPMVGAPGPAGDTGPAGGQGPAGPSALTFVVGNVTTLDPGSDATVGVTQDGTEVTIDLGLPRGLAGPVSIEIAEIITVDAGTPAGIINLGTAEEQLWQVTIPRGRDAARAVGPISIGPDYAINDIGTSAGSSYVCIVPHESIEETLPTTGSEWESYWQLLAAKGAQGEQGPPGVGGLQQEIYDPNEIEGDAFDMDNMVEGETTKIMTLAERTKLAGIASGATANSSDGYLLDRANHTGPVLADLITDGAVNKAFTAGEKAKLAGIATGATANDTDANLKARANHTGTQLAATISDFSTAADARISAAIAVTVQAYSANLTALAAVTPGASGLTALAAADAAALRTAAGLGTAAVKNVGTSGDVLIAPNVANTFETGQTIAGLGNAELNLNKNSGGATGNIARINAYSNGFLRWRVTLGSGATESGSDTGSDFSIIAVTDAGGTASAISISRATRIVTFPAGAVVGDAAADPVTIKGSVVSEVAALMLAQTTTAGIKTYLGVGAAFNHIAGGWVTATSYAVGDWLTHNDVAYYCISAHTSGSTTEPGVGASWETRWEANPFGAVTTPSNIPLANLQTVSANIILGRSSTTGIVEQLSPTSVRTILNVANGATANSSDAYLLDRTNHTGSASLDTTTDSGTRIAMTPAERTKLGGVAAGATANSSDATLLNRANHTGTQDASTIADNLTKVMMLATERLKLDGIAAGATANIGDLRANQNLLELTDKGQARQNLQTFEEVVDAKTRFGVKGNGIDDDTAAVTNALNAAAANGYAVAFPPNCRITSLISTTASAKPYRILTGGFDIQSAGGGIRFNMSSILHPLTLENIDFMAGQNNVGRPWEVLFPIPTAHRQRTLLMRNVRCFPKVYNDNNYRFLLGGRMSNAWHGLIHDYAFNGGANGNVAVPGAIIIDDHSVNVMVYNGYATNVDIGFVAKEHAEGIHFLTTNAVTCNIGFDLNADNADTPTWEASELNPQAVFYGCHTNANLRGIKNYGYSTMIVHGHSFYRLNTMAGYKDLEVNRGHRHFITKNFAGLGPSVENWFAHLTDVEHSLVEGNQVDARWHIAQLEGSTNNTRVVDNRQGSVYAAHEADEYIDNSLSTAAAGGPTNLMISHRRKPKLILATGQSNMARTNALANSPPSNLRKWNGSSAAAGTAWVAGDRVNQSVSQAYASNVAKNHKEDQVLVVNISQAALGIIEWTPAFTTKNMMGAIDAAMTAVAATIGSDVKVSDFLWYHAENDAAAPAEYPSRFESIMTVLKGKSYWDPETRVLVFGMVPSAQNSPDGSGANAAPMDAMSVTLRALAEKDSFHRAFVATNKFPAGATYWADTLHLSGLGCEVAGKMAYNAMYHGAQPDQMNQGTIRIGNSKAVAIAPPFTAGHVEFVMQTVMANASFDFNVTNGALQRVTAGTSATTRSGTLSGTTGDANRINYGVGSNGLIYVENRLTGLQTVSVRFYGA